MIIIICSCSKGQGEPEIKTDSPLCEAIMNYNRTELKLPKEQFERKGNLLITRDMYYAAFYEEDLEHA